VKQTVVKLFVEGGGDDRSLRNNCREAFRKFLEKAGFSGYMPRIVSCGSRNSAYDDYCTAVGKGENCVLLVDSEDPVSSDNKPWEHLKERDDWSKPDNGSDEDCHFMVQLTESWFLADVDALKEYFGHGFNENSIPTTADIETVSKKDVIDSLEKATQHTKKGFYNKGNHSFDILSKIDPSKIIKRSKWAKRFADILSEKMRSVRAP